MDVSFFENIPYYASPLSQGACDFHDPIPLPTPVDVDPPLPLPQPIFSPPVPPITPPLVPDPTPTNPNDPPPIRHVYSRRRPPLDTSSSATPLPLPVSAATDDPGNPSILHTPTITDLDVPIALRKPPRACTRTSLYPIAHFISLTNLSPTYRAFASALQLHTVPATFADAMSDPKWSAAVLAEMDALATNKTWEVVKLHSGKRAVGCRWIFTIKYHSDGSVERYKARLVAKGYTQTYGVDYEETFAPVAKLNTVRVLLSLAANLDWPLYQLDVTNAFLNGDLEEEVYMKLPPGFLTDSPPGHVCRLRKAIYGLKQSPRAWFGKFTSVILTHGYSQAQSDHTLFFKHSPTGLISILIVYVDDIVLTGSDLPELARLKRVLSSIFVMKDLGSLRYFLGMEVARSTHGIALSQHKYVLDLLRDTGLLDCKPASVPMDPNEKLCDVPAAAPVDKSQYQHLVGRLIYLAHTRPDIAHAVSVVS